MTDEKLCRAIYSTLYPEEKKIDPYAIKPCHFADTIHFIQKVVLKNTEPVVHFIDLTAHKGSDLLSVWAPLLLDAEHVGTCLACDYDEAKTQKELLPRVYRLKHATGLSESYTSALQSGLVEVRTDDALLAPAMYKEVSDPLAFYIDFPWRYGDEKQASHASKAPVGHDLSKGSTGLVSSFIAECFKDVSALQFLVAKLPHPRNGDYDKDCLAFEKAATSTEVKLDFTWKDVRNEKRPRAPPAYSLCLIRRVPAKARSHVVVTKKRALAEEEHKATSLVIEVADNERHVRSASV